MRIWDCGLWRGNGGCRANEGMGEVERGLKMGDF
jgi:hypothetical protein